MLKCRPVEDLSGFAFLPDSDRYVSRRDSPEFKFNQIGCGTNGLEHILVGEVEGSVSVHGVYDPNERSVEAARTLLKKTGAERDLVVHPDLASACTDPEVDALIISTPNHTHLAVVRAAIEGGKHILLEKPMATDVADAKAILDLANGYGQVFQIGLQYRYKPIYREAVREALSDTTVGDIKTISVREHRIPFLDKVGQWNKFAEYSGGTLVEKCCHYFDLMNLFSQSKPRRVMASGGQAVNFVGFQYDGKDSDIIDHAYVIVEYKNGIRACLDLNMFVPLFNEEMILCGSRGWLRAAEQDDFISGDSVKTSVEVHVGETQHSRVSSPCYPKHIEETGHHGSTFFEHVSFAERMRGNPTDSATVEDGYWSIVVGYAAEKSIRENRPVDVDEVL